MDCVDVLWMCGWRFVDDVDVLCGCEVATPYVYVSVSGPQSPPPVYSPMTLVLTSRLMHATGSMTNM